MNWQKKLGYIVPASNAVVEFEVQRMLPAGVSAHFTRAPHLKERAARLRAMVDSLPRLADELAQSNLDALCFACTTGSFSDPTFEPRALAAVRARPELPGTTAATALVSALRTLCARRLTIVTPYPDEYNALLAGFLSARGFEIVRLASLYSEQAETLAPETIADFVQEKTAAGSDAVVISCTKLRTLEIIERLEGNLNVPVVSSISACHWHTMRLAGLHDVIAAGGQLFRHEPAPDTDSVPPRRAEDFQRSHAH